MEDICPQHTRAQVAKPVKEGPGMSPSSHGRSPDRQDGNWAMREHTSVFTFVYGKGGLTPWLFLAWYTEFCLCLMLLGSSKNAKACERGDSSGSAP